MITRFLGKVFSGQIFRSGQPKIIPASEHGIDRASISGCALRTTEMLQRHGYAAFVVGGAVRDLILGGKPKDGGIASLVPLFPRVAKAYLIGVATEAFAETLEGKVPYERCGTLDVAVAAAARDAEASGAAEPVVLLSPACASFDQYRNFEMRGDAFRALVAALPGITLVRRAA